jgi:hypothetical protein
MNLTMLYRGPLASCDYDCPYCPFAKRRDSREQLRADREALHRFTSWVGAATSDNLSILFTPWGEGLVRSWYRQAMAGLSHLSHVKKVAIQTNLSCRLNWVEDCDLTTAAFWVTYHPTQVGLDRFLNQCGELTRLGARYSVGIVGLPDHLAHARRIRDELQDVYLWVNAAEGHTYTDSEAAQWQQLDPLFHYSRYPHHSLGQPCRTGNEVVSVLGDGTVRRCHFVQEPLGNLYDGTFRAALQPRRCPLNTCDCHIGYVHLEPTGLYDVFQDGVLERIPAVLSALEPGGVAS